MKKGNYAEPEIELVMIDAEDILTASNHQTTTRGEETTANPVDTADDLPWDTMG